jgi:hypothetical protein
VLGDDHDGRLVGLEPTELWVQDDHLGRGFGDQQRGGSSAERRIERTRSEPRDSFPQGVRGRAVGQKSFDEPYGRDLQVRLDLVIWQ